MVTPRKYRAVALGLAAASNVARSAASAFVAPARSRTRPIHHTARASTPSAVPPFLAAPPGVPPGAAAAVAVAGPSPPTATVTTRLPLGTLFDGREYVFVTESNVRGYEWTTKEADVLLDDLMDAALGNLGGSGLPDGAAAAHPPPPVADYELSQVVLVPTADWDPALLGLGARYDVYDGQQRLVTLSLLLAGLRDAFREEARAQGAGKRAVALAATAGEVGAMLRPPKVRKGDVRRIALRPRDDVLLARILGDEEGAEGEDDAIPVRRYSKLTPRAKAQLLAPLSAPNARIFHNFVHLATRLAPLTTRERLRLLDYVVERVHLLVCVPETSRIARNIVMSQGRRGMDNEPVDDFKGLVCFRYTLEEGDMYRTFDRWDALAAAPAAGAAPGTPVAAVGRDVVAAACVLRAGAALRTKIRTRGGDEVYDWERWLRQELWRKNQPPPQSTEPEQQPQPWQGRDFFVEEVRPAAVALHKFRTGQWEEFAFLSKTNKNKLTKRQRETIVSQLSFLRDLVTGVASAKEGEIAVLELLLRAEGDDVSSGTLSRYLNEILPLVETWTLWMALAKPSPMERHAPVFALLDAMDDLDSAGALGSSTAPAAMSESLRTCMDEYEFGATAGGKRLAAAILKRMSTHLMIEEKRSIPEGDKASTAAADAIETHWPDEEAREEWAHRLGTLALVSSAPRRSGRGKKTAPASSWESKRERYRKEPWSLTRQLAELEEWDMDTLKDHQRELLSLLDLVWKLE